MRCTCGKLVLDVGHQPRQCPLPLQVFWGTKALQQLLQMLLWSTLGYRFITGILLLHRRVEWN